MPFSELYGNQRIKHILTSYLNNQIIPFSMVFFGPGSAGTIDFALAFAKAVNCLEMDEDFCGSCRNCQDISKGIFPDVLVLNPEGQHYKKGQIAFLINDNFKKPLQGDHKIYILNTAHMMNENSANAFLKVLEEPTESCVFILLTTNLSGLLPTIRSRCQILSFSPLGKEEMKKILVGRGIDPKQAKLMAYLSQGSMDSILNLNFAELMQKRAGVLAILDKLIRTTGIEDILLDLSYKSRNRSAFIQYFREMINLISSMLRDIMILQIDENSDNLINIDYRPMLLDLTNNLTVEKVMQLIRRMEYLLRDVQRNLNAKVLIQEFIKSYTSKEVQYV